jgi:hypothetical protein
MLSQPCASVSRTYSALPAEIQSIILGLVRDFYAGSPGWMPIMGVCRLWRDVALNHHLLWAETDPSFHPYLFSLHISRSTDTPLDVRHRRARSSSPHRHERAVERRVAKPSPYASVNLLLACTEIHRLRSLSLLLHQADVNMLNASKFFFRSFPILEYLHLENQEEEPMQIPVQRIFRAMPHLQELILVDIDLPEPFMFPSTLEKLTLERVRFLGSVDLPCLLAQCARLREVRLNTVHEHGRDGSAIAQTFLPTTNDSSAEAASLLSLDYLQLRASTTDTRRFIDAIKPPAGPATADLVLYVRAAAVASEDIRAIATALTSWTGAEEDCAIDQDADEVLRIRSRNSRMALSIQFICTEPNPRTDVAKAVVAGALEAAREALA